VNGVSPLPPAQAVAAVVAVAGPAPESGKYVAHEREDSLLTVVSLEDVKDRGFPHVWAGGGWLVGPDAKVYLLSSNYSIHNWTLAESILSRLYRDGLASRVEPDSFVERLARLTRDSAALVDEVLAEAKEGRLRAPAPRVLP
jgi:hypothetical protein